MKKLFLLAGLFLLPFLASAYELPQKYADMAEDLTGTFEQAALDNTDSKYGEEEESKTPVEKIKDIIYNARENLSYMGEPIRVPMSSYPLRRKFFNTDKIIKNLQETKLTDLLDTNYEVLNEVANYIVDIHPNRNDFETLLAVGVNPIEAAIRLSNKKYIESALKNYKISYDHYYQKYDCSHEIQKACFVTTYKQQKDIKVYTSKEEILEIVSRLQELNNWKAPQWLSESSLQTTIKRLQLDMEFPLDYYVDKIETIIESSINLLEDKIIFQRYYNTGKLKTYLEKYKFIDILKNEEQVLHEAANYIVNHYPHNNDFEALLAIGVDPVEAAIRLNNEEYIQSALENGTIVYPHCYIVTTINMDTSKVFSNGYIEPTILVVNTTPEQIEEIKLKIKKLNKGSHPLRKLWNKISGSDNFSYFHG